MADEARPGFSPGDSKILLALVKAKVAHMEKDRLRWETKGRPFPSAARFKLKRLRSIGAALERGIKAAGSRCCGPNRMGHSI